MVGPTLPGRVQTRQSAMKNSVTLCSNGQLIHIVIFCVAQTASHWMSKSNLVGNHADFLNKIAILGKNGTDFSKNFIILRTFFSTFSLISLARFEFIIHNNKNTISITYPIWYSNRSSWWGYFKKKQNRVFRGDLNLGVCRNRVAANDHTPFEVMWRHLRAIYKYILAIFCFKSPFFVFSSFPTFFLFSRII